MGDYTIKKDKKFSNFIENIIRNNFPDDIINIWIDSKIILAGNSIKQYYENKKIDQLDFFCIDWDVLETCVDILNKNDFKIDEHEHGFCIFQKNNLKIKITFLKVTRDVMEILEHFGFTIDKIAYYHNEIIMHKDFLEHIKDKKIVYCGSNNPSVDWGRYEELLKDGYSISKEQLNSLNKKLEKFINVI